METIDRSQRPVVSPLTDVHLDFPQCRKLSCGIPIWVVSGGDEAVNRLSVYVKGGIMHEDVTLLSLLTATMVLEGSKNYTSSDIAERLDYCGAWKLVQNHDEMNELSLSSVNEYYADVLPILVDALGNATFPEQEFDTLKRRYAASYATMRERVKYLAAVEMRRLCYGADHPLVADVSPEAIMQLTVDDLRKFYQRFFHPANCCLILSGLVTDEMLQLTDEAFSKWTDPENDAALALPWQINPSQQMMSIVDKPGAIQTAIAGFIRAIGRENPDYLPLRMLCTVLGGYFGSRLMSNIREEKGYTYGIHAFLSGRKEDGYIGVSTECDVRYTWQVLDEIKHEMRRLNDELVSDEELNLVRQYMLSEQVKTLDTPFSVASYVSSTLLYGVYPEYYNRQIDTILHITPQQLREIAQRYLDPDKLQVVVAGDKARL